ncbi:hypothetical protein [Thioclava sp. JE_KL1]|uniref:DUF6414 family protein n=1 Tax=Thioclava sp. JE_KL1 TaxID=2651187 RepID=UPI00128CB594|nr:hypothetical protein [Thioclava sp. JE_KL1]MPQ93228.1 hypothetical protein [Thioclava sp. JE_KL1]
MKNAFQRATQRFCRQKRISNSEPEPLREFVYLDEVSLASLLASQKGEITDNITSQTGNELGAEISGSVSTHNPLTPSAEVRSRFQTTNSNSLQTIRKATAQSLFRELHKLDYLRKIQPVKVSERAKSIEDLRSTKFSHVVHSASDLKRGDLIEFKVRLSASWIFQISTMVAEFSDMFDESPVLFIDQVNFLDLYQARNANKIISKLLAGLIPVDGVVSDYVVVKGEENLIVHRDAIKGLDIEMQPLRIVGVTEHLAYWKDIRRILFADNEFTILCRLSKSNIQNNWNPIKAADIFKEFAPDLSHQIEATTRAAMMQSTNEDFENRPAADTNKMVLALRRYKDILLQRVGKDSNIDQISDLDRFIADLWFDDSTAEGQRAAFASVKNKVVEITEHEISSDDDLAAREHVRNSLKIPLLSQPSRVVQQKAEIAPPAAKKEKTHLLDVEVVAIYW